MVKYRILSFKPENNEFIVSYYYEKPGDGYEANIPLPFNDDKTGYLLGRELREYILGYGPQETVEMNYLAQTLPTAHIDAMVYDPTMDMTPEEIREAELKRISDYYNGEINEYLDEVAMSKDYDGFDSLSRYANSTNETWKQEALTAQAWCDRVWEYWYGVWNDFVENDVEIPPWETLKEQLPKIEW